MQALYDQSYLADPAVRTRRVAIAPVVAPLIRVCRAMLRNDFPPLVTEIRFAFLGG